MGTRGDLEQTNKIVLKEIQAGDVSCEYLEWMNDPETNQYLESRLVKHTLESTMAYVEKMKSSPDDFLFGVYREGLHVGNIKIGNIHRQYKRADVGLVIGKQYWGKGVASEAIRQATEYAFQKLALHKLYAGIYAKNEYSLRAFLKNGWRLVGEHKDHAVLNGEYIDCYLVEIVNSNS